MLHPVVAARSCDDCRKWLYADKPDDFARKPVERNGKVVARPPGTRLACSYCPKQPAAVPERERRPETAVELSEKNWLAWQFYRECRAVNQFPDDPIVRRCAGIIRTAEDAAERTLSLLAMTPRT
jgi:hypothetical protein